MKVSYELINNIEVILFESEPNKKLMLKQIRILVISWQTLNYNKYAFVTFLLLINFDIK